MKNSAFILLLFVLSVTCASADPSDLMKEADALFVYHDGTLENYQKSIDIYKRILDADPDSYEAAWKYSRALRYYANTSHQNNVEGWKDICKTYGKEGMKYAQKAIDLKPDKPNGYLYFGMNAGIYADGVSMVKALKEGLKDKAQGNLEKAFELDPNLEMGGPMVGLGRFWTQLPWPMKDKKKALGYFRKYQASEYFGSQPEALLFFSELLIDIGGKKNKEEALNVLRQLKTENPYYIEQSRQLQARL